MESVTRRIEALIDEVPKDNREELLSLATRLRELADWVDEQAEEDVCDHKAPYGSVTGCERCGSKYLHFVEEQAEEQESGELDEEACP